MGLEGTCIHLEFSSQKNIEHMLSGAELVVGRSAI